MSQEELKSKINEQIRIKQEEEERESEEYSRRIKEYVSLIGSAKDETGLRQIIDQILEMEHNIGRVENALEEIFVHDDTAMIYWDELNKMRSRLGLKGLDLKKYNAELVELQEHVAKFGRAKRISEI